MLARVTDTTVACVNEDGVALGLPRNELATELCFDYQIGLCLPITSKVPW